LGVPFEKRTNAFGKPFEKDHSRVYHRRVTYTQVHRQLRVALLDSINFNPFEADIQFKLGRLV